MKTIKYEYDDTGYCTIICPYDMKNARIKSITDSIRVGSFACLECEFYVEINSLNKEIGCSHQ